jgi:hypothetical protein
MLGLPRDVLDTIKFLTSGIRTFYIFLHCIKTILCRLCFETHVIWKETQFDFLKQCMKKSFVQKNSSIYFLAATGDGQYTVKNMMQIYRKK